MKAIVYSRYGPPDVLQLRETARPKPRPDQVLVKVHAASVNALDYRRFEKLSTAARIAEELLFRTPGKVLGADIAGRVEAAGTEARQFKPGDAVFGVSAGSRGGFAEYACACERHLALKPASLSFEEAAAVPVAASTALQGLRDKGRIQPGQRVLIHGASGGVGTFAVQIARSLGAEVTAVCSTRNLDMARSIGADHVVDYRQEDFTRNGQRYDLILAVNGHHPLSSYRRALSSPGAYVCVGGTLPQIFEAMLLGPWLSGREGKKLGFMGVAKCGQEGLAYLGDLLEAGKVVPVIDRCYPLGEVPAAVRYLVEGHAKGKVVITVGQNAQ